jgi:maleylpyruvate isomerase
VIDADLSEAIAGARDAQARLVDSLATLSDADARGVSLLPGWSVGHVLTHLARNADSHVRMLRAALRGEAVHQYAGDDEGRQAGIEAGAARPADELVSDVAASAAALEQVWDEMTPEAWAGHGINAAEEIWPCSVMPFHRWREVELHRVDLGLGHTPADWPTGYVGRELALSLAVLPERLSITDQQRLLGWLVDRAPQPAALTVEPWQARREHYLRS